MKIGKIKTTTNTFAPIAYDVWAFGGDKEEEAPKAYILLDTETERIIIAEYVYIVSPYILLMYVKGTIYFLRCLILCQEYHNLWIS